MLPFSAYGPIIDKDQRELYRAEFEAGSREYNWMYGLINAYIKVFSKLERKLKAASPSEIEVCKLSCETISVVNLLNSFTVLSSACSAVQQCYIIGPVIILSLSSLLLLLPNVEMITQEQKIMLGVR